MLYNKVVEFCKKEGIPVYVFEKECGLGNGTIRGWKMGNPRLVLYKKWLTVGLPVSELLG